MFHNSPERSKADGGEDENHEEQIEENFAKDPKVLLKSRNFVIVVVAFTRDS